MKHCISFIKIPKLFSARDIYQERKAHQQIWLFCLDYLLRMVNTFSQKLLCGQF